MVELHAVIEDEAQVVAVLELAGTEVRISNADAKTAEFMRQFVCIVGGGDLTQLTIQDGEPWLEALPRNLRGTYLWAQEA